MAKYNKYVQIGNRRPVPARMTLRWSKVLEKYKNVVAVLEDVGRCRRWTGSKKMHRSASLSVALPRPMQPLLPVAWRLRDSRHYIHGFTFACVGRAYNQIRQSILVDHFNVKITSREVWGEMGVSHNVVEGDRLPTRVAKSRNPECRRFC